MKGYNKIKEDMVNTLIKDICFLEKIKDENKVKEIEAWVKSLDDKTLEHGFKINRYMAIIREKRIKIESFIKENGYSYTVEEVVEAYKNQWIEGPYFKDSMKHCIKNLAKEIEVFINCTK
ncbi:hypothetical protein [Clostridium cylindrosporum]|uniref:Uncharacterized protein n=1 Tax=Clostridium cylindrosporum DSM 605 TaxID=1121307 RepID=A0A0J8DFN5_CLOCY|nr:hypothetical protein [Clostridium cylindrosporum]KMT22988.1 hypothetical protein CLCY_7c00350 [Clostridium cylindrosporum DSM 605]